MAYFTDVLNTVFQVTGGAQLAAEMQTIALTSSTMAGALNDVQIALQTTTATLGPLALAFLAVAAAVTVVKAAFDLVTEAVKTFVEESKALFHVGVILKNLGSTLSLPQVKAFADQLSGRTGLQRPAIEEGAAMIARTGIAGDQIPRALKTIADTARATGYEFTDVAKAAEKGFIGADKMLKDFGITLQDTGSRAANVQLVLQQLNLRFQGAAEAYRQTLPGAIEAMQSSLQKFLSALGEEFAPVMIRVFNMIADGLDFLTRHAHEVALVLSSLLGPIGPAVLLATQQADRGKDPLAKVGMGGDPATEKTLLQVADNTKVVADSVIQQVLGGQGQIVQQAFGYLTARMALAI